MIDVRAELLHGADPETFRRAVVLTSPVVASAVVAPSPFVWAAVWGAVAVGVGVRREIRIRRKAATPASPQVSGTEDSRQDSRGQLERTVA